MVVKLVALMAEMMEVLRVDLMVGKMVVARVEMMAVKMAASRVGKMVAQKAALMVVKMAAWRVERMVGTMVEKMAVSMAVMLETCNRLRWGSNHLHCFLRLYTSHSNRINWKLLSSSARTNLEYKENSLLVL